MTAVSISTVQMVAACVDDVMTCALLMQMLSSDVPMVLVEMWYMSYATLRETQGAGSQTALSH